MTHIMPRMEPTRVLSDYIWLLKLIVWSYNRIGTISWHILCRGWNRLVCWVITFGLSRMARGFQNMDCSICSMMMPKAQSCVVFWFGRRCISRFRVPWFLFLFVPSGTGCDSIRCFWDSLWQFDLGSVSVRRVGLLLDVRGGAWVVKRLFWVAGSVLEHRTVSLRSLHL